uniref:Secreted protein n=1 Tax=Setaria viridis TaxID=4556 RepID=A0A4V6Y8K9_SETVI|nr:hypothetical protein SEVIR_3G004450v2 [Setaria viridis]
MCPVVFCCCPTLAWHLTMLRARCVGCRHWNIGSGFLVHLVLCCKDDMSIQCIDQPDDRKPEQEMQSISKYI